MADRGMTGAVAALVDEHDQADAEDAQFGLFAPPASTAGQATMARGGWSGVGRKPGARNKRTSEIVAFILSRHRHPLVVLAELAEANVFDLAALLGCTPFEAAQEKRLAAIGLAPYVAGKITPDAVDNRQIINLYLDSRRGGEAAATGAIAVLGPGDYETVAEASSAATDDGIGA